MNSLRNRYGKDRIISLKKALSLLLALLLVVGMAPSPVVAVAPPIQFALMSGTWSQPENQPGLWTVGPGDVLEPFAAAELEAVAASLQGTATGAAIVVHADVAPGDPYPTFAVGDIHLDKSMLIASNVILTGIVETQSRICLLGGAEIQMASAYPSGNDRYRPFTVTGTSDTGTAKAGFVGDLSGLSATQVMGATEGALLNYTLTLPAETSSHTTPRSWDVDALVIPAGKTLVLGAWIPQPGDPVPDPLPKNHIRIFQQLQIGAGAALTADPGQELELIQGASVEGISLFAQDGSPYVYDGSTTELFAYTDNKWTRQNVGGGDGGGDNPPNPQATHTVTVTAGAHGTVSPAAITVNAGEDLVLTATPEDGYRIQGWYEGDVLLPPSFSNQYELSNIGRDMSLRVEFESIGDGTLHTLTFVYANGTVTAEGMTGNTLTVMDGYNAEVVIVPNEGYSVGEITMDGDSLFYSPDNLNYEEPPGQPPGQERGRMRLRMEEVRSSGTITIDIPQEELLRDVLGRKFAITVDAAASEASVNAALRQEFGYFGYILSAGRIDVLDIDTQTGPLAGIGTFTFRLQSAGTWSEAQTGYIMDEGTLLFAFSDTEFGEPTEFRLATQADYEAGAFSVPAADSGYMHVVGPLYGRIEGGLSDDVRDKFVYMNPNKLRLLDAFYRLQLHVTSRGTVQASAPMGGTREEWHNWFGFDLIQENAYAIKVEAFAGSDLEQRTQNTFTWDLNRFAELTEGDYTSRVYFGNDTFTLRKPANGVGAVDTFTIAASDSPGYTVTAMQDGSYQIAFQSDFYDYVALPVTINGTVSRTLHVERVGVNIVAETYHPGRPAQDTVVFHGTQYGTNIVFGEGAWYQLFATFNIPDYVQEAPYGLFATYEWGDGTITTRVITQYETRGNFTIGDPDFAGIFYDGHGDNPEMARVDYQLGAWSDAAEAPVRVNVTVLKEPGADGSFGGVLFGSGRGVEWTRE